MQVKIDDTLPFYRSMLNQSNREVDWVRAFYFLEEKK